MKNPTPKTRDLKSDSPILAALRKDSTLRKEVKTGLEAVLTKHRSHFDNSIRNSFADSVDIDEGFKKGNEQQNRWDYLLGHKSNKKIIGVEPHSAENSEISTVISRP